MSSRSESQDETADAKDNIAVSSDHRDDYHDHHGQSTSNNSIPANKKQSNGNTTSGGQPTIGYYDAEKCRQHIANQIRVNKIDRFSIQLTKASEIEGDVCIRLGNLLNMFTKCSAQVATEFTLKCKLGIQRHRLDRILNHSNKNNNNNRRVSQPKKRRQFLNLIETTDISTNIKSARRKRKQQLNQLEHYSNDNNLNGNSLITISNDLLYGEGASLVQALLSGTNPLELDNKKLLEYNIRPNGKLTNGNRTTTTTNRRHNMDSNLDHLVVAQLDSFEPDVYVGQLECCLRLIREESNMITGKLNRIGRKLEQLAAEHRAKVDLVYAAEESRQSSSVIRRSAYNLSQAAIKATTTPVHVISNSSSSCLGGGGGHMGHDEHADQEKEEVELKVETKQQEPND